MRSVVVVSGEDNEIGTILREILQHSFDRIRPESDDLLHIESKFRHGRLGAARRKKFPAFQGLAHAGELRPVNFIIRDVNQR